MNRPTAVATATTVAAALLVTGLLVWSGDLGVKVLAAVIVAAGTVAQVVLLRRRSGQTLPLPALAILIINAVGLLGYFIYPSIENVAAVSAKFGNSAELYTRSAQVFTVASLAIFAGGMVLRRGQRRSQSTNLAKSISALPSTVLVTAALVPVALLVLAYGPAGLLQRASYLDTVGGDTLHTLGTVLGPAGVALISFLVLDPARRTARPLLVVVYAVYVLLFFAMGSRVLSLLPALLLLSYFLHRSDSSRRPSWVVIVLAIVATGLLLQLPLNLRSGGQAGLVPFLGEIAADPGLVLQFDPGAAFGNVLFAFPLAGYVASGAITFPTGHLSTSFNPLPGSLTDWPDIYSGLRVNIYTPYNGLGELAGHGLTALAIGMFAMSFAIAALQRASGRATGVAQAFLQLAGLGLTVIWTLDLLQYNLRSGVRIVYYFAVLVIAVQLWSWARRPADRPARRPVALARR